MWVLNPSVWRGCIYSGKGFWQFQSGEQLDERWAVALREENGSYLSTWVSAQLRIKRWGRTDTDVVSLILSAWHTSSWLLRSAPSFLQGVFLPPHAPDTLPGATNDENLPLIGLGMWSKVGQYVPKTFWIRPPGEKKKKRQFLLGIKIEGVKAGTWTETKMKDRVLSLVFSPFPVVPEASCTRPPLAVVTGINKSPL